MTSQFIKDYVDFLKNSPTPYHATLQCKNLLKDFMQTDLNIVSKPGNYYQIYNSSLLIIISIPENPAKIKIIATHNDSPCLKLRPNALKGNQVSLQTYGGGLWHTWFDRSLALAGKIITKDMQEKLFDSQHPLFYIPSLAPHLNQGDVYNNGFSYNKEKQLRAVCDIENLSDLIGENLSYDLSLYDFDEPRLIGSKNEFVASARQDNLLSTFCAVKSIIKCKEDFDLKLNDLKIKYEFKNNKTKLDNNEIKKNFDNNKSNSDNLKIKDEFDNNELNSDNNEIKAKSDNNELNFDNNELNSDNNLQNNNNMLNLNEKGAIKIVAVFDFEEVGSNDFTGAKTSIIKEIVDNLKLNFKINIKDSFIISCDVAHAFNENYSDKYQSEHTLKLGKGMAIKHSQKYSTNCYTSAYIKKLAKNYQEYCNKNDCPGGSTIGPMLSSNLGIQCVDIGAPILGMHSIKEMSHVKDIEENFELFYLFFND